MATRESSDSVSAANGGLLPEFGKGQMDQAFEKAAMSLPLNVVSEPVLSQFGYHLIKVEGRTGGKVKARHILIPIEITGQHRNDLDARADQFEALAAGKLDPAALDTAARALGLTVGAVNPLQQGSRAQIGFQVIPDAGVWAFQAAKGETSPVIEVDYAYFIFRLDSTQAEGVPPFDAIKADVEAAARDEKKIAQGGAWPRRWSAAWARAAPWSRRPVPSAPTTRCSAPSPASTRRSATPAWWAPPSGSRSTS